jgi:hypothetical protein
MGEIIHLPDQSWYLPVMDCFMERAVRSKAASDVRTSLIKETRSSNLSDVV